MNASANANHTRGLTLWQTTLALLRHYSGGRRGLIVAAAGVTLVALTLYLSWGWLAAIGVAPLLLALAPCAALCALGLCADRLGGRSCSPGSSRKPGED